MGRIYKSTDRRLPTDVRRAFDQRLGQDTRRPFNFAVTSKAFDPEGEMIVEGIANLAEPDRWGEVIVPSAYRLDQYKANPIILYGHDRQKPVGTCTEIGTKIDGLYYKASLGNPKVYPLTACQLEVRSLVAQQILRANSVGFIPKLIEWDEDEDVLRYTDVELLEISIVAIPMQQDSIITSVKSWRQRGMDKEALAAIEAQAKRLDTIEAAVGKTAAEKDARIKALETELADVKAKHDAAVEAKGKVEAKTKSLIESLQKKGLIKPKAA